MSILNSVFDDEHGNKKPVGTKITHSNGKVYVKESTGWYNSASGIKLDYKSSLILESSNEVLKEKPSIDDESNTDDKEPEKSEESNISSSIPNGYVYSSGKGNKYIMKNGTWYSVSTKKPVLSSNVNMLNRAAEKSIENFNATSDVKIGAKVTSNAGTEYTFNGTGFTNPNGKLLTGGAAQSAMNKLKQQATPSAEPEAEVQDAEPNIVPGESAIDTNPQPQAEQEPEVQSNTDTAGPSAQSIVNQGENAPQQEPSTQSNSTAPVNEPNPTSSPNEDTGPLQNLAKQIKGNKYAKQIVQLLSRGGNVNLIAADVLLKGNISEVIGELNALNNSNTQ